MRDLPAKPRFRVFLNYPFDEQFADCSNALHFAVTAANLIPVCAKDFGAPDQLRLHLLTELVSNCDYSAHDLSRHKPDPSNGLARMNMPLETGMALYRAITSNWQAHRCALLVTDPYAYRTFVSDLAGLDPVSYTDELSLVTQVYDWLVLVGPQAVKSTAPAAHVADLYIRCKSRMKYIRGSGLDGRLNHAEIQELIRRVCEKGGLWTWRSKAGPLADEFPSVPLLFQQECEYEREGDHRSRKGSKRRKAAKS
jgi:hypothetical protein